jgi:hypothetical protein
MRPIAFLAFFSACLAILASLSLGAHADGPSDGPCQSPGWIYFDLGNTLIDTHDWDHLRYFPEAQAYLAQAHAKGFHLGLITNVPESWGADAPAKVARLKAEVASGWQEAAPFNWADFEEILVPLNDTERKPAPILFERALAAHHDCPLYYEGEEPDHVRVADHVGLESYLVGAPGMPFYMPLPEGLR